MTGSKDMLGRGGLLTVRQAWDILAGHLAGRTTATETLPLVEAFDRILAKRSSPPPICPPKRVRPWTALLSQPGTPLAPARAHPATSLFPAR
jgi:hypothetical protein